MSDSKHFQDATRLTTLGRDPAAYDGVVSLPVHRASTILFPTLADFEKSAVAPTETGRTTYGLIGTPTTFAVETAVAELEGAHGACVVPSGLAAITAALLAVLKAGDHLLITDSAYGPGRRFSNHVLKRFGVEVDYYDPLIGGDIARLFKPNTKAILTESPGSYTFEIQDIPAIAEAAHKHGALVLMDNTWATPLYYKPFAHGVDISIQAATKYMSGHSDLLAGTITFTKECEPLIRQAVRDLGISLAPDDCYLLLRGMRSMAVRLKHQERVALDLANWLATRPEVKQVLHPARPDCPGHALWKRDFTGASGLFSIILHPIEKPALAAFLDHLSIFGMGFSWGGFESLIVPCDPRPIRTASPWTEPGQLIRISVGLEHIDDLKGDLAAGFARMAAAR